MSGLKVWEGGFPIQTQFLKGKSAKYHNTMAIKWSGILYVPLGDSQKLKRGRTRMRKLRPAREKK